MRSDTVQNAPLDQLAMAYGRGLLTPFIGAGVSRNACPSWSQLVCDLEVRAGVDPGFGDASADLIRRALRAVRALRHNGPDGLEAAVHWSLYRKIDAGECDLPRQTVALARLWWPLVLTTNYDSLFIDAWNEPANSRPLPEFNRMIPLGRTRNDCQRVLNATRGPDNPILWALQGFIQRKGETPRELVNQITIGHVEYRRQIHEAVHFRRAFAEIYRSRVLLFIGSGLQESYLLDLFGEALELLGTIDHFHYALVAEGSVDPEFLRRRFQIRAIEYKPTEAADASVCVSYFLESLRKAVSGPRARTQSWTMKLDAGTEATSSEHSDISVLRSKLPDATPNEAVALSAGSDGSRPLLGHVAGSFLARRGLDPQRLALNRVQEHIFRVNGHPVYVVVARDKDRTKRDARDFRFLTPVMNELMSQASIDGFRRVSSMLLAAGPLRTFPQYISLYGMVQGYCAWRQNPAAASVPLDIHVVDPAVIGLLEAGRINLASMIISSEVRFWIEIQIDGQSAGPELTFARADSAVLDIVREYSIPSKRWFVSVRPAPSQRSRPTPIDDLAEEGPTLTELGVLNGSTLIFAREVAKSGIG